MKDFIKFLMATLRFMETSLDYYKYLQVYVNSTTEKNRTQYNSQNKKITWENSYKNNIRRFYHIKTIPQERYSQKSLRGYEIKCTEKRKQIKKNLENKL